MMTEKRFDIYSDCIHDKKTDERLPKSIYPLVDKLNEFAKELEQLNHDLDMYEGNNTNEVLNALRIELTSRLNDCIEEFKQ